MSDRKIKIVRVLQYTGIAEDVYSHLRTRGIKESAIICHGKVLVEEAFIGGFLGFEHLPSEVVEATDG